MLQRGTFLKALVEKQHLMFAGNYNSHTRKQTHMQSRKQLRILFHGDSGLAVRIIAHTCGGDHTCSVNKALNSGQQLSSKSSSDQRANLQVFRKGHRSSHKIF